MRKPRQVWYGMIRRCNNKNAAGYEYYGGRGISVCTEWLSFRTFAEWFNATYVPGLSIDRIDNDGNYEPANCRWATRSQQNKNKRFVLTKEKLARIDRIADRHRRVAEKVLKTGIKPCPKCLSDKPLSDFHICRARLDGRFYICKPCMSFMTKEYKRRRLDLDEQESGKKKRGSK